MKPYLPVQKCKLRREQGLTLIEMMVSSVCLLFIVLGLTTMFLQTQRAFKIGTKQSAISDSGRAIVGLLANDLAQICSAQNTNIYNCVFSTNISAGTLIQYDNSVPRQPLRTNTLEDIYAITRSGASWQAFGYSVMPTLSAGVGVGTLYRYSPPILDGVVTNRPPPASQEAANALSQQYTLFTGTNWMTNIVAEGIVHLHIRAFDTNGVEIPYPGTQLFFPLSNGPGTPITNLPALLELELGILEPEALEHVRALGTNNAAAQTNYLAGLAGQVQVYHQQIPIRMVTR